MSDGTRPAPNRVVTAACGACGEQAVLRRGRCPECYDRWLRARLVGVGACCASCGDRRLPHLRYFELPRAWVVLCHNCTARAEAIAPRPYTVDALLGAIARERREVGEPRACGGEPRTDDARRGGDERRARIDRRLSERNLGDASEIVIEMEAEYAEAAGEFDEPDVTTVHGRM